MINNFGIFFRVKLRELFTILFAVVVPIVSTFVSNSILKNKFIINGHRLIDYVFINGIFFSILALSLFSLCMDIVRRIETNQHTRLKYFGLSKTRLFIFDIIVYFIITIVVILINIILDYFLFKIKLPNFIFFVSFVVHIIYASIPLYLISIMIGMLVKNSRNVLVFIMPMFTLIAFFSDLILPTSYLGLNVKSFLNINPIYLCVKGSFDIWIQAKLVDYYFIFVNSLCVFVLIMMLFIQHRIQSRSLKYKSYIGVLWKKL